MVSVEVCANSVQSAIEAQKGGAVRVELCGNLFDGGTTPAASQIELTRNKIDIQLNVIIRPRGGDFLYDEIDFVTMKKDIELCGRLGCDGVVIGMLDRDGNVDMVKNAELIKIARRHSMSVTFHRAFDRTNDLFKALSDVIDLECDRILTSGGYASAFKGKDIIKQLVEMADNRVIIMAGAGVKEENVEELVKYTGVKEVHGTFQSLVDGGMIYHNPNFTDKAEYSYLLSDQNRVADIVKKANF